jgi:hypothetical protein
MELRTECLILASEFQGLEWGKGNGNRINTELDSFKIPFRTLSNDRSVKNEPVLKQ